MTPRDQDDARIAAATEFYRGYQEALANLADANEHGGTSALFQWLYNNARDARVRGLVRHLTTRPGSQVDAGPLSAADPDSIRYQMLREEMAVIAAEFSDAAHDQRPVDRGMLRSALVLIAATAGKWVDVIDRGTAAALCDDQFNSGGFVFWHCTLSINHSGRHAYINGDGNVLAMWPNTTGKDHP